MAMKQTPGTVSRKRARLQRQATGYARLAAKAERAGETRRADDYRDKEARLRARARRS